VAYSPASFQSIPISDTADAVLIDLLPSAVIENVIVGGTPCRIVGGALEETS
jgi:hypothetical protein